MAVREFIFSLLESRASGHLEVKTLHPDRKAIGRDLSYVVLRGAQRATRDRIRRVARRARA
jgi:hypothetical protein